jgi:hypothetical protein
MKMGFHHELCHSLMTSHTTPYIGKWESIMLHMVNMGEAAVEGAGASRSGGGKAKAAALPDHVRTNLEQAGLIITTRATGKKSIGKRGFQFLLMPMRQQLWFYLLNMLSHWPAERIVDSLALLFKVGLGVIGRDYPVAGLTKYQRSLMSHLDARC